MASGKQGRGVRVVFDHAGHSRPEGENATSSGPRSLPASPLLRPLAGFSIFRRGTRFSRRAQSGGADGVLHRRAGRYAARPERGSPEGDRAGDWLRVSGGAGETRPRPEESVLKGGTVAWPRTAESAGPPYFKRSASFASAALAQAASLSPPGAPLTATAPMVTSPT